MNNQRTVLPPVDPTRRRFLSAAASVAAGGTALALAAHAPASASAAPAALSADPDPVYALIETHRQTQTALNRMYADFDGKDIGKAEDDILSSFWQAETAALENLIETIPGSLPAIVAWVSHLASIAAADQHRMDETYYVAFVANLSEALNDLVSS